MQLDSNLVGTKLPHRAGYPDLSGRLEYHKDDDNRNSGDNTVGPLAKRNKGEKHTLIIRIIILIITLIIIILMIILIIILALIRIIKMTDKNIKKLRVPDPS